MRVYLKHLHIDFFTDMYNMLDGGRNGVEAFFIISGFFLILTFKNFLGKIYQKYKDRIRNLGKNIATSILFSALELFTFGFIIWWSYFKLVKIDNSLYVAAFVILFVCFLLRLGILSKFTDKDIWTNLSKYTYSLYCIHLPVSRILSKMILNPHRDIFITYPILTVLFTL